MPGYDLLVIGGGVTGVRAAIVAKELNPRLRVAVVSADPVVYTRMSLDYVLKAGITDIHGFTVYQGFEDLGIRFYGSSEVLKLDLNNRVARVKGPVDALGFDKLIIATGSRPVVPDVEGTKLRGIFTFHDFEDAISLHNYAKPGMRACVVGAGMVGLLVADALRSRGVKVFLVDMLPGVALTMVDGWISEFLEKRIKARGVDVITNARLEKVEGASRVERVVVNGERRDADIVVFAVGVKPAAGLAVEAGIRLGRQGAIKTDNRCETSVPGVYAIGDCAASLDYLTGKEVYRPLGIVGVQAANIAGSNAAGFEREYRGIVPTQYEEAFGTGFARVGLNTMEAKGLGLNVKTVRARYRFPGVRLASTSLVVYKDDRSKTVIGWQAAGPWLASLKSGLFERAVREGWSLDELVEKNIEILD